MRFWLGVVLVIGCGSGSRGASGPAVVEVGTADASAPVIDPDAGPATRPPTHEESAQTQLVLAKKYFAETDYKRALEAFASAQKLDPRPENLYDIGRCLELMGERLAAAAAYEEYVRKGNLSYIDRSSMELRISVLRNPAP